MFLGFNGIELFIFIERINIEIMSNCYYNLENILRQDNMFINIYPKKNLPRGNTFPVHLRKILPGAGLKL